MKVKVKKYKTNFEKSCELLKAFSKECKEDDDDFGESEYFYQHYGFCEKEFWDLDYWIAANLTPRLIYFKEHTKGYPGIFAVKYSDEEAIRKWKKILDSMIIAFQIITEDRYITYILTNEKYLKCKKRIIERGLKNFIKYYSYLWD